MAFPAVTLLDSFKRIEEPLGITKTEWKDLYESSSHKGKLNGNEWETKSISEKEGAYWHSTSFKEPGVALELTFTQSIKIENYWSVWACIDNPEEIHFTGYRLRIEAESAGEGGFKFRLEKATLGIWTVLAEQAAVTMKKNYRFGLAVQSGKVSAWRKIESGSWIELFNHADSSYTEGYVGFNAKAQDGITINFEAGPEESKVPTVENPGTQHARTSKSVSLQIHALNVTKYFATNLPTGLSISESTGLITGEPEVEESPVVKIKVEDEAKETAETSFEWVVSAANLNVVRMILG